MSNERELTSKEKFDAEMKEINKTISPTKKAMVEAGMDEMEAEEYEEEVEAAQAVMDEYEDEEDEVEDEPVTDTELDKSMGTVKHVATKEDHSRNKLEATRQEILAKMKNAGGMVGEKLSPDNQIKLKQVMDAYAAGKVKNPVLLHLIKKKLDHAGEFAKLSLQAKEIQAEIISKMGKITEEIMQSRTKSEIYNKDILELADQLD